MYIYSGMLKFERPKSKLLSIRILAHTDFRCLGREEHAKSVQKRNIGFGPDLVLILDKFCSVWALKAQTEHFVQKPNDMSHLGFLDVPFLDRNLHTKMELFCSVFGRCPIT